MSEKNTTRERLSARQQDGAELRSRRDRRRLYLAIRALEDRLGAAASTREELWWSRVLPEARGVVEALQVRVAELEDDESIFADIARSAPRLLPRAESLLASFQNVRERSRTLVDRLEAAAKRETPLAAGVRRELGSLLIELRDLRAQETDLIFEAFQRDLGTGD